MNLLERLIFEPQGGMFREFEGLTAHFEARDAGLFRQLLPNRFAMPHPPIVTIFVADYLRVAPWFMRRYQEWTVLLKAESNGTTGWYSVTMPVTHWSAVPGGRYLGFPKFITDEIVLIRTAQGCSARARYRNEVRVRLEFCPGVTRPLQAWERDLIENPSFFKGENYQLTPPGRGPQARKIAARHVAPAKWSPEVGMMRVWAHPGESWYGLLPAEAEFPGTYNHFTGSFNLYAELLR